MLKARDLKKVLQVFSLTGKYLKLSSNSQISIGDLKVKWSQEILALFSVKLEVINPPLDDGCPCVFVGNHISYLDIPVIFNVTPEVSFLSKNEVKSWPVIGNAASRAGTIFVKREKSKSRENVKVQIGKNLSENNKKIIIFPSGTTSLKTSYRWKKGAFEITEKNNIKICPFRIRYSPLSEVAYVGNDNFISQMYHLFSTKEIRVTIEYHRPVLLKDSLSDCNFFEKMV